MSVSNAAVATAAVKKGWPEWIFRKGHWVHTHNWTEEERDFLRREYRYTIQSLKELASKMGMTNSSIRHQLTRMGLLKLTGRWTENDEKFLEENYSRLSLLTISRKLHKSPNAVVGKAHRLQVTSRVRDGWFTLQEVSQILGVDQNWIHRRMNNGFKFEIEPHNPSTSPKKGSYSPWHISEEALRDFIRRYPEELTGHNVDFVMLIDILAGVKN